MNSTVTLFCVLMLPVAALSQEAVAQRRPLQLSLRRAVDLALSPEGNPNIQLAQEGVKQAQARSAQARGALLPDLAGSFGWQNTIRSLSAEGLDQIQLPFGIVLPRYVGPFPVMDARATVRQSIFDLSTIRRFQSSKAGVRATMAESDSVNDQIAAQVAKAYLAALRSEAELEAVKANVALAEAVLQQTQHQKMVGTGTGIEVTRAQVQLSNEQQRQLVAENHSRRAHLQLLKVMGLRLDTDLQLTDKLAHVPVDTVPVEQALAEALKTRPDWKSQQQREETARLSGSAVKMERVPSLVGFADYGAIGPGTDNALPTRTYGFALRVPVFDGGRREARRSEAESQYRQERVRTRDMQEQIELDIRLALDGLRSAEEQVKVAEEGLSLADNELNQARRRYDAGVTTGLEVTDAQTRLERARDNRIAALFNHNLARIDLGQATGAIRRMIQ